MAITRKPKATRTTTEVHVEDLINEGDSTSEQQPEGRKRRLPRWMLTTVVIRLPPDMLERVDAAVDARPIRIPRHTWILEAILEKLERSDQLTYFR